MTNSIDIIFVSAEWHHRGGRGKMDRAYFLPLFRKYLKNKGFTLKHYSAPIWFQLAKGGGSRCRYPYL